MAKKQVWIDYTDPEGVEKTIRLKNVTNFEMDEQLNSDSTPTYDGPVTEPSGETPWELTCEKLNYEGQATAMEMDDAIDCLRRDKAIITHYLTVSPRSEAPFTIKRTFSGCVLSGNNCKIDAEKSEVNNFKAKAETMDKDYIDPIE